jgi:hypothetical protein
VLVKEKGCLVSVRIWFRLRIKGCLVSVRIWFWLKTNVVWSVLGFCFG